MPDYVVDAAAIVKALTATDQTGFAVRDRVRRASCHAPYLLDAEVGSALRSVERRGEINDEEAQTALAALPTLIEYRYAHTGRLSALAWETRHTITFYDGLYVALATVLDLPLLTADRKLAKAPGLTCAVELVD